MPKHSPRGILLDEAPETQLGDPPQVSHSLPRLRRIRDRIASRRGTERQYHGHNTDHSPRSTSPSQSRVLATRPGRFHEHFTPTASVLLGPQVPAQYGERTASMPHQEANDIRLPPPTMTKPWRVLERTLQRTRDASVPRGRRSARASMLDPDWDAPRRIRSTANHLRLRSTFLLRRDEPDIFHDEATLEDFVTELWAKVTAD
jgi:hypothetical protein